MEIIKGCCIPIRLTAIVISLFLASSAWADLQPFFQDIGKISLSVDAEGNNDSFGGTLGVNKPIGATVRKAFLLANSHGVMGNRVIADGDVTLAGSPITWDRSVFSGIPGSPLFF